MCAATLLEWKYSGQILLIEKNSELGKKVSITGWGRCNVTTGLSNTKKIVENYPRGQELLKYALQKFPPTQVIKRFESHNTPLKTETDNRVFPASDKSQDIIQVFEKIFAQHKNIEISYNTTVNSTKRIWDQFEIHTNKWTFTSKKLIITTGGKAYEQTGSAGDGYTFAQELGHTITKLWPSLTSFITQEKKLHKLSGLSFPNAKIIIKNDEKQTIKWPLLFTHFGISGPLTFKLSAHLAHAEINKKNPIQIQIQIDKDKNFDYRNNFLINETQNNPKTQIKTILKKELPNKFIEILNQKYKKIFTTTWSEFTKENRKTIAHLLSGKLSLKIIWRKPGHDFVTAGGIKSEEINPKTMESQIIKSLFFWGEILNIYGYTGGFNLQAARSTGRLIATTLLKRY